MSFVWAIGAVARMQQNRRCTIRRLARCDLSILSPFFI